MRRHNGWMAMSAAFVFAVMTAACDNTARGARRMRPKRRRDAQEATADAKAKARRRRARSQGGGP